MPRTLGLIGSGAIGTSLARLAVTAGLDVVLSNSRGPETLTELVDTLSSHARAATPAEAAHAVPCPSPETARRPRSRPATCWMSSDTTRWTSARSQTVGGANRTLLSTSSPTADRRRPDRGRRNAGSGL
ncbi:NAD(P)-binding domain-containing protein [Streptomyces adustus]